MILVMNSGSSTIKMALLDSEANILREAAAESGDDMALAMHRLLDELLAGTTENITAVGHRVVHGGERFIAPTLLNAAVIAEIDSLSYLAPLHNPANLLGIRMAMEALPDAAHIAVFDTAFHHTMPAYAYRYAVPDDWYEQYGVRRYGFHGSSHHYVAIEAAKRLGQPLQQCHLLTLHLGNGCSAAAIAGGVSIDTSMGMTPLEGLVMGTRSGDIDPGLHDFIARQSGASLHEINSILNRESGLLGVSGLSHDMRALQDAAAQGHQHAALAIALFCYRLAKTVAALAVALGRIDAIVFTGGIGEHAALIRAKTVQHLGLFGAHLDAARNDAHGVDSAGFISPFDASLPLLVVATSEERMIARYVLELLQEEC